MERMTRSQFSLNGASLNTRRFVGSTLLPLLLFHAHCLVAMVDNSSTNTPIASQTPWHEATAGIGIDGFPDYLLKSGRQIAAYRPPTGWIAHDPESNQMPATYLDLQPFSTNKIVLEANCWEAPNKEASMVVKVLQFTALPTIDKVIYDERAGANAAKLAKRIKTVNYVGPFIKNPLFKFRQRNEHLLVREEEESRYGPYTTEPSFVVSDVVLTNGNRSICYSSSFPDFSDWMISLTWNVRADKFVAYREVLNRVLVSFSFPKPQEKASPLSECKHVGTNAIILNIRHEGHPYDHERTDRAVINNMCIQLLNRSGFDVYLARSFITSEIEYCQRCTNHLEEAAIAGVLGKDLVSFLAQDAIQWDKLSQLEQNSFFSWNEWLPWGRHQDAKHVFIERSGQAGIPVLNVRVYWFLSGSDYQELSRKYTPGDPFVTIYYTGGSLTPSNSVSLQLDNPIHNEVYTNYLPADWHRELNLQGIAP